MRTLKVHLKGSLTTALVVGTLLVFINHTKAIIDLNFGATELMNWSLNYVVPFTVSLYSRMASQRNIAKKRKKEDSQAGL